MAMSMSDDLPLDLTRLPAAYAAGTLTPADLIDASAAATRRQRRRRGLDQPGAGSRSCGPAPQRSRPIPAARARAAVGGAVRGQGQYRRRRPADHGRLPGLRLQPGDIGDRRSQRLLDAGAILIGKTNLDQFATGLVGVRTPYGVARNPFDPAFMPGGSSSGSAVAVAAGLVSFALGTDTAGSGRVPAAFNNIVGLKPTKGLIPTQGVVPACRSLDCISIFALTAADAAAVLDVAGGFESDGPVLARDSPAAGHGFVGLRLGVPRPEQRLFFGDAAAEALYDAALARATGLGARLVEVDLAPFLETAALLYAGPWVAERAAAVGDFLAAHPDSVWPTTRAVIETAQPVQRRRRVRGQLPLGGAGPGDGSRPGTASTRCCCRRRPPSTG